MRTKRQQKHNKAWFPPTQCHQQHQYNAPDGEGQEACDGVLRCTEPHTTQCCDCQCPHGPGQATVRNQLCFGPISRQSRIEGSCTIEHSKQRDQHDDVTGTIFQQGSLQSACSNSMTGITSMNTHKLQRAATTAYDVTSDVTTSSQVLV